MSSNAVTLVVPSRFAGPPGTANGGWISGRLAGLGGRTGPVQVTLREPAPLEVALEVRVDGQGTASLGFGGALIAEATAGTLTEVVDPVDHATAQAATTDYAGWAGHPFPGCFVCGPDRPPPDGLGVFPGPLDGRPGTVATTWLPDAVARRRRRSPPAAPRLGRPGLHQRLVQRPGRPAQGARPDHRRGRRGPPHRRAVRRRRPAPSRRRPQDLHRLDRVRQRRPGPGPGRGPLDRAPDRPRKVVVIRRDGT